MRVALIWARCESYIHMRDVLTQVTKFNSRVIYSHLVLVSSCMFSDHFSQQRQIYRDPERKLMFIRPRLLNMQCHSINFCGKNWKKRGDTGSVCLEDIDSHHVQPRYGLIVTANNGKHCCSVLGHNHTPNGLSNESLNLCRY
jgi:hypothetical protein